MSNIIVQISCSFEVFFASEDLLDLYVLCHSFLTVFLEVTALESGLYLHTSCTSKERKIQVTVFLGSV
jgi:hypothetical protein